MDELVIQLLAPLGKISNLKVENFYGTTIARGNCDCDAETIQSFSNECVQFSYRRSRAGHGAYAFRAVLLKLPQPVIENE
jgi:UDP-N-acetylenolpyruvoylglucosamine reductase